MGPSQAKFDFERLKDIKNFSSAKLELKRDMSITYLAHIDNELGGKDVLAVIFPKIGEGSQRVPQIVKLLAEDGRAAKAAVFVCGVSYLIRHPDGQFSGTLAKPWKAELEASGFFKKADQVSNPLDFSSQAGEALKKSA